MNGEAKPVSKSTESQQRPDAAQAPASPPLPAESTGGVEGQGGAVEIVSCGELVFETHFTVLNSMGLHVRPATNLATMAGHYKSTDIWLVKDEVQVDAKVPLLILTLAGVAGTHYKLRAKGPEAKRALTDLHALAARKFDVDGD